MLVMASCGGGSSSGGGIETGGTPYTGLWQLIATLNVNVGGTQTFITDTSQVFVRQDGVTEVRQTDSQCSLDVGVIGDVMTYRTSCIFTVTNEDLSTSCTLTLTTRAMIRGAPGDGNLSASFGPKTEACRGVAAAFTGNLVGTQDIPAGDSATDNGTNDTNSDSA
jgi:hypothetical protein